MEALGSPAAAVTSSFGGWHLAAVVVLCAIGAAEVWGVRSLGRLVRTARKVAESPCGGECEEKTKRRTSPSGVRGYGPMTWLPSHPSGGKGQGGAVTFAAGAEASALLSDVKDGVVSSVVIDGTLAGVSADAAQSSVDAAGNVTLKLSGAGGQSTAVQFATVGTDPRELSDSGYGPCTVFVLTFSNS